MNYNNLENLTAGDILPGAIYLGSAANANNLTAYCTLGQGSNYPDNGFWYILQMVYNATNKKQFAMSYRGYAIRTRQMIDGIWSDWGSILTNADLGTRSVTDQFTGSNNCEVYCAYKTGNIVQLWVILKNITQGWTDFPLTTKLSLATGSATPGIMHKATGTDSIAQISCTYNGVKVTTLSNTAAGATTGIIALFTLIIK